MPAATARLASFDARLGADPRPRHGRVTESYRHAAVVELEGGGLVLLTHDRPLVPWGVSLPEEAPLPGPGSHLLLEGARLCLAEPGREEDTFFFEGVGQDLFVPCREEALHARQWSWQAWAELPPRTRELLQPGGRQTEPAVPTAAPSLTFAQRELALLSSTLQELLSSVLVLDGAPDMTEPVRRLVGLGRGSTPSGDDLLTGASAAARATGRAGARALCACLSDLPCGLTTPAGHAMLGEAARGFYPAPLAAAARALPGLDPDQLKALASLGATSGADMLAGFLATLEEPHA